MACILIISHLKWISFTVLSYSIVKQGHFLPDSRYYQAERGLSTIKINKNRALQPFTGHQQNRIRLSLPKSARTNWRKLANARPTISRRKKSFWRGTETNWPNTSRVVKAFGCLTAGSKSCLWCSFFATLLWYCGRC